MKNPNKISALEERADRLAEAEELSTLQQKIQDCHILKKHKILKGFKYEKVGVKEGREQELKNLYKESRAIKRRPKKKVSNVL